MIQMTFSELASLLAIDKQAAVLTAGKEQTVFRGLSIDSRTLQPDNLFIAIAGTRVDGHEFLAAAKERGAAAALVSREVDCSLPQFIVNDVVAALGKLSAAWRQRFQLPLIAVTGSNGKTTLKNMIAAILNAACHEDNKAVLATQGTLNNHLGLPLTVACLNEHHRYGVIELGMNHFGEIAYLTQLAKPQVAVITNAAAAHLAGVGSIEGVARAKAEIFLGLPQDGTAILNRDDAFFDYWRTEIGQHACASFGFHREANYRADLLEATQHTQHILVHTPHGQIDIQLPLLGKHNVMNALAASAAVSAIGIDLATIKKGLESILPAPGRLQPHTLANGVIIIDDTYNANPFSLQAAVDALANFAGKKILVLGDMKELGQEEKYWHQTAGEKIRQAGIDYLFTYGELSANTSQSFGEGAYHFNEQEKLLHALKPFLYNQTTILIKGSRSMRMEKVVAGLVSA